MAKIIRKKTGKQAEPAIETAPTPDINKNDMPMVVEQNMIDARMLALRHPEAPSGRQK